MKRPRVAIAGFGVQGSMFAARAVASGAVRLDDLLIIDRWENPLSMFEERLRDCRTEILRSGHGDHIAPDRDSLRTFAEMRGTPDIPMALKYKRPSAKLFVEHARMVVGHAGLQACYRPGLIAKIRRDDAGIHIASSGQNFTVDKLYLAMGMDAPDIPEWGNRYRGHDSRVAHVFDRDYEPEHLPEFQQAAVVGGGITAVQVTRSLVLNRNRRVLMITRRPLDGIGDTGPTEGRTSSEDWKDPGRRRDLCSRTYPERLRMLESQGDRGTIPPWDREWLAEAIQSGMVEHRVATVAHLDPKPGAIDLILSDDVGTVIPVSLVVMATGLQKRMHEWLLSSARALGLPFCEGEPVLDETLQWGKDTGIHVLGHHAAPVVGPYGGNIGGGIIASEICCGALS